jgi:hypothetical protein
MYSYRRNVQQPQIVYATPRLAEGAAPKGDLPIALPSSAFPEKAPKKAAPASEAGRIVPWLAPAAQCVCALLALRSSSPARLHLAVSFPAWTADKREPAPRETRFVSCSAPLAACALLALSALAGAAGGEDGGAALLVPALTGLCACCAGETDAFLVAAVAALVAAGELCRRAAAELHSPRRLALQFAWAALGLLAWLAILVKAEFSAFDSPGGVPPRVGALVGMQFSLGLARAFAISAGLVTGGQLHAHADAGFATAMGVAQTWFVA